MTHLPPNSGRPTVLLAGVIFGEKFIQETTSRIYPLKRELLSIKRAVWPLVDVRNRLMRFDLELAAPEDTKPYFRSVYDHAVRINEMPAMRSGLDWIASIKPAVLGQAGASGRIHCGD